MDLEALTIPEPRRFSELLSLTGRSAVVTGASRGIGRQIAVRLAEAGASVLATGRDTEALGETVELITQAGGRAMAVEADAASLADGQRVIDTAVQRFGTVDILVNNAAVSQRSISLEVTEKLWDDTVDTDLKGAFFLSQFAARVMIAAESGGRIINILSTDAFRVSGFLVAYNAAKAGLFMVTKSMAKELAEHQIRVNAVAPGSTVTSDHLEVLLSGQMASFKVSENAVETRKKLQQLTGGGRMDMPLDRPGFPDDIATAVLVLAAPISDYISGQCITVDGAQSLR